MMDAANRPAIRGASLTSLASSRWRPAVCIAWVSLEEIQHGRVLQGGPDGPFQGGMDVGERTSDPVRDLVDLFG